MRPVTSIEELDRNILTLCTRINAATYELLVMIREFEQRGGHLKWGLENCAEWLAWRCDLSMTTALEKVRVARALKTLPVISSGFSTGELSYSKVRELTRIADANNEEKLAAFALRHTATQVAERCRELRMGDVASLSVAERAYANRSLRIRRDADRGMLSVTVDLPLDTGELLDKALDKARGDECLKVADPVDASWSTRQADAFVTMVQEYLDGCSSEGRSDNYLVTIHVDQSALAGNEGRSTLPIESVKRLCCDTRAVVLTEDNGEPLGIGRKSRIVPAAMQRAVRARDNDTCTFPGCTNHRFLHCHHVEHWSNGGVTALDNLMLLCTKHHTLVHEGRFSIRKDFNDNWVFYRPDGIAVPDVGYHSRDWLDTDTGELSSAYENPPAGGFPEAVQNLALEPPPPAYRYQCNVYSSMTFSIASEHTMQKSRVRVNMMQFCCER